MFLLAHFIHGFIHVFHDMKSVVDDFGSGIRHMRHGRREIGLPHIHRDGPYGFQLARREPATAVRSRVFSVFAWYLWRGCVVKCVENTPFFGGKRRKGESPKDVTFLFRIDRLVAFGGVACVRAIDCAGRFGSAISMVWPHLSLDLTAVRSPLFMIRVARTRSVPHVSL